MIEIRRLSRTFVVVVAASSAASADPCGRDIDNWLDCNNPRAVKYLSRLGASDVGSILKGFSLTDGNRVLEGYRYLGRWKSAPKGVHLFLFEKGRRRIAYLWVEKEARPFPLPRCPEGFSFESAYVLSGDVYTFAAAQQGHGVIHAACVAPTWVAE